MIYLKTVSTPGPFLFLRPSHWPHIAYKVPSQPAEGALSALELVPTSLSRGMPTSPCPPCPVTHKTLTISQRSLPHPGCFPLIRSSLHPQESHYLSSPGNGNILSTGKEAQCLQEATCEQLSWDPRWILLLWGSSPHSPSVSSAIKVHRTHKSKHISAGKCNSRWWVKKKKKKSTYLWDFFSCAFTFPAKQETFYCNSIHLEQQAQVVNEMEGRQTYSR